MKQETLKKIDKFLTPTFITLFLIFTFTVIISGEAQYVASRINWALLSINLLLFFLIGVLFAKIITTTVGLYRWLKCSN